MSPSKQRGRLLEHMFETLGFAAVSMQSQAVLSLYSQGLMSGLVVDLGASATHVVPVVNGWAEPSAIARLDVAGDAITQQLGSLLEYRGYCIAGSHALGMESLKERNCYVALDFEKEEQLARDTTCLMARYVLPDGQAVWCGEERFQAPEVLFQPHLLGLETPGLADAIHACIHALPIDLRLKTYSSLLLTGGTSMLPGLSTRIERELTSLYLDRILKGREEGLAKLRIRIEDPPMRQHMAFMGASIFASIVADFDGSWVTKADWEEDPAASAERCSALLQGTFVH